MKNIAFPPFRFLIFALVLALLSACTRQRPPLPTLDPALLPPGPSSTLTPGSTVLPARTPHVTATPTKEDATPSPETPAASPPPTEGEIAPRPGQPTPPTNAPSAEPKFIFYTVKPGDTLFGISARFGVNVEALRAANQMDENSVLRPGQELKIPLQARGGGYVYVVKPGDTLYDIAQRYNVPLDKLAQANGITDPTTLRPGQTLIIPALSSQSSEGGGRRIHVVQPGETITSIAAQYGVNPDAIVEANDLQNPSQIFSGQQLIIP